MGLIFEISFKGPTHEQPVRSSPMELRPRFVQLHDEARRARAIITPEHLEAYRSIEETNSVELQREKELKSGSRGKNAAKVSVILLPFSAVRFAQLLILNLIHLIILLQPIRCSDTYCTDPALCPCLANNVPCTEKCQHGRCRNKTVLP